MDRLLARLERKLGRFAIERLITYVVGGMAMVFVLGLVRPEFVRMLELEPRLALSQPWRFVTFLFIPQTWSLIWVLFSLYFTWLVGSSLENEWGAFKFNVYYFLGALGTAGAAYITGDPQGSMWLHTSMYFAFATVFPNYELYIFFLLRVKVKWLALIFAAFVVLQFVLGDLGTKAAIGVALGNYLLFFSAKLVDLARGRRMAVRQAARRAAHSPVAPPKQAGRACAICGASQDDGADIRVCSCEKCGGPRDLCLEHARNH
jgi:membrane associated rhomboid family serine protease